MLLHERVVLIEHGGVPGFRDQAHEAFFGRLSYAERRALAASLDRLLGAE